MKIIQIFPGKVWGGAEQYVFDLGNALAEYGHDVIYLTRNSQEVKSKLQGKLSFETLPLKGTLDFYSIIRLANILKKERVDVIHIHDTMFVPLVIMSKSLSHTNARVILTRHIARGSHVNPLFRNMFKQLHNIIFVSELAKKMWTNANKWMPTNKCNVVHNSIPPLKNVVSEESLRDKYHISKETPLIIFTGRIRRSKGCAALIQSLGRIKNLPFIAIFIGTCKPIDYGTRLLQLAKECGIQDRIIFYGFSDKVRLLIQDADIGVAPSIVREACPLSPMEFMQAGKCIIATNNGAQPEYISSGKNGILVSPDNIDELSKALISVIENPDFRKTIGNEAQLYFDENLSYNEFIKLILEYYI